MFAFSDLHIATKQRGMVPTLSTPGRSLRAVTDAGKSPLLLEPGQSRAGDRRACRYDLQYAVTDHAGDGGETSMACTVAQG
jgi:hypothetical protein